MEIPARPVGAGLVEVLDHRNEIVEIHQTIKIGVAR